MTEVHCKRTRGRWRRLTWCVFATSSIKGGAKAASAEADSFLDPRLVQGWDGQKQIGDAFAKTLALTRTAWDVYLIYPAGVEWREDLPPKPAFWMHQLDEKKNGADPKLELDAAVFSKKVDEAVSKLSPPA
jgi:hypothetical protein